MKKQNSINKWVRSFKYGAIAAAIFCIPAIIFLAILGKIFTGDWIIAPIAISIGLATIVLLSVIFAIGVRIMHEHWIGIFVPPVLVLAIGKIFPYGYFFTRIDLYKPTLGVFITSLTLYAILRRKTKR
jgi:hypothetical protein